MCYKCVKGGWVGIKKGLIFEVLKFIFLGSTSNKGVICGQGRGVGEVRGVSRAGQGRVGCVAFYFLGWLNNQPLKKQEITPHNKHK